MITDLDTTRYTSLQTWCANLQARRPTPGGGAAAAASAALGCATGAMAARYTTGKKWAEWAEQAQELATRLVAWQQQALDLAETDQRCYQEIQRSWRSTDLSDEQRQAIAAAALAVPLQLIACCQQAAQALQHFRPRCNPQIVSDVDVALGLLLGAAIAARVTALVNQPDQQTRLQIEQEVAAIRAAVG
jgi:methenyltetrahydrofolate cyclohydrolase